MKSKTYTKILNFFTKVVNLFTKTLEFTQPSNNHHPCCEKIHMAYKQITRREKKGKNLQSNSVYCPHTHKKISFYLQQCLFIAINISFFSSSCVHTRISFQGISLLPLCLLQPSQQTRVCGDDEYRRQESEKFYRKKKL